MRKRKQKLKFEDLPKDYQRLCSLLPPRPIHDRVDYETIAELTDTMAGHELSTDQEDYFDLLCRLIEDWESSRVEPPKTTPLQTLQHLLESHGMTAADLARLLNVHRTLGAMILRGERALTLKHVSALSKHFGLSADAFLD